MDKLTKGWVQHLRNTARQESNHRSYQCPLCGVEVQPNIDDFKAHILADKSRHPALTDDSDIEEAFQKVTLCSSETTDSKDLAAKAIRSSHNNGASARKRPGSSNNEVKSKSADDLDQLNMPSEGTESSRQGSKRLSSPPASITQQRGSSPSTPGRSRAKQSESTEEFDRGQGRKITTGRQLWTPDDARRPRTPKIKQSKPASSSRRQSPRQRIQRHSHNHVQSERTPNEDSEPKLIRQLDTRPISSEQLVAEVKGIYAGLLLLEQRCIEYNSSQKSAKLSEEQYHALISLHRSLLHEHHDFFLASQHPSASDALRRLASKYTMPARMWRHGIQSFLELLRHKLPDSLEHMLTFIYIAYSMMALLYETVPTFEGTWIECLGDLGRYRMAIEDDDIRDREIWTGVSRSWYTKASDKAPTTGRLYHHLAILARPNALQQLYYYAKSLCVPIPFASARESVMTLFDPLLIANSAFNQRLEPVDAAFVRVHGILFSGNAEEQLEPSMKQFLELLDGRIGREHGNWLESGYHVGISLSCLLLGFGNKNNVLMQAISQDTGSPTEDDQATPPEPTATFEKSVSFATQTYDIVIRRWGDKNTLPCLHTTLAFYWFMSQFPAAMKHLDKQFPWKLLSVLLNYLLRTCEVPPRIDTEEFPGPEKNESPHPLPEDYAMRGLIYTEDYFPNNWFDNHKIDEDEKYFEPGSTVGKRRERILWIGRRIASQEKWLLWDNQTEKFSVTQDYDVQVQGLRVPPEMENPP